MPTLYLTQPHSFIKKDGDTLIVQIPENKETGQPKSSTRVPLHKVDHVVIQGNITLTTPALMTLTERHIEVTLLDHYGRFQGHLSPPYTKNGQLRLAQANAHTHYPTRITLAQAFVRGKLANMRTMLLRFNRKHQAQRLTEATQAIKGTLDEINLIQPEPTPPNPQQPQHNSAYGRLQGLEGHATAQYFTSWKTILNQPDLFNGRTRRPPRDPANALLSYGYTILLHQTISALYTVGLDPYIGYLHSSQYGKPALALDLIEEFRPLIVDSVVLNLLNTRTLQPKDFIHELGTYRLTDHGRRTFLTKLEARFDETLQHPTFNYQATYRRALELQARLLAKTLMGEIPTYPPLTVR